MVGIGASAGGLEALEELFAAMPADTGMAFVVVTHLHPTHKSLLPELLGRCTSLPVVEAADGVKVEPNRVYVAPPGSMLAILGARLQRMDLPVAPAPRLPIDYFLRSLADDQGERAICVILSGTGTDGTLGLRAVKGGSGMAMVQEPSSARFSGMPASAIATGLADFVLAPRAMPQRLVAYSREPYLAGAEGPAGALGPAPASMPGAAAREDSDLVPEPLQKIFVLLRARTGHDFSGYKPSTIRRRIERRMAVHQIVEPQSYVRLLQSKPEELEILFKELLITVTSFFRDAGAFESLAKSGLAPRLAALPEHASFRVWAPGCATGEEVYSLAILLREGLDAAGRQLDVKIFGTDLDSQAIEVARIGRYPEGIAADVSAARLERFFVGEEGGYRVRREIREMTVFAVQNVIRDPPFTRLDLLVCRNLLIYLNADLQRRILPMFHYALKPGGLLFLGPSETLGGSAGLFDAVDKRWKIYRRRETATSLPVFPATAVAAIAPESDREAQTAAARGRGGTLASAVERLLLGRFAPASVIVGEHGEVVYSHGRTGAFLELAVGKPSLNILDMAREGLRLDLASALREAAEKPGEVVRSGLQVTTNGGPELVELSVRKLREPGPLSGLLLVTFRPLATAAGKASPKRRTSATVRLERELQATRESLQSTIRELETSNEELKSANEELQSINEEMQSANEELETSKEEMQSLNEELTTVNAELESKLEELSRSNDDMQNLLNSIEIATIFLDKSLHIARYTEQTKALIHLIPSDIGRPIGDLTFNLIHDRLVADCQEVLRNLVFKQLEVESRDGQWYLMRILPYRTADNVIDGLVMTFVNISQIKEAQASLRRLATILRDSHDAITVHDLSGAITAWNRGAEMLYGWSEAEALHMNRRDTVPAEKQEEMTSLLERLAAGGRVDGFATDRLTRDGRTVRVWLTATALTDNAGCAVAVATTERGLAAPENAPAGSARGAAQ